ncbi:MAG: type II toxin-antitoxin system HicB family antitoxin [Candidatus Hydrogenedentes bacterium]|nr:type II toxin-antitoxin system HicB family antitoxin [Candidatus Hydrogenedentota bacterium]
MRRAVYQILSDDGTFYGAIPECEGLDSNADTLEACREELELALEDWILFSIAKGLPLPTIDGIELVVKESV